MKLFLYYRWQVAIFYWAHKFCFIQICVDEDIMSSVSIFSVESLSLVQPFNVQFISKYFVKVNLQLYLASAFTFSIFFYMNHLISYCPNVWTFLLTCKFDAFCNYTVVFEALCMPSSLFLHSPWSILLSWLKLFTWSSIWWFNSLSH